MRRTIDGKPIRTLGHDLTVMRTSSSLLPPKVLVPAIDVVEGLRMHSLVSSRVFDPAATPLVFVHGLGMSVRYMEPTMARLASQHPVAGVDLPGFGRSESPPSALDVRGLSAALGAWMDVRGIGPAVLIGNSYGCQVIVDLVACEPQRALGLVLNAPTMDPGHRTVFGQIRRALADIPFEPWRLAGHVARDYTRAGPRRLFSTLRHALRDRIEDKLPHIVAPTLVVCGARDPVVTAGWCAQVARLIGTSARTAGGTLEVLPNAAHAVPFHDPVAFAATIDSFIGRALRGQHDR